MRVTSSGVSLASGELPPDIKADRKFMAIEFLSSLVTFGGSLFILLRSQKKKEVKGDSSSLCSETMQVFSNLSLTY